MPNRVAASLLCVVMSGCTGLVSESDAGLVLPDAGEVTDASVEVDAGTPDAGAPDAGPPCSVGDWCEDFETGGDAGWTSRVEEDAGLFLAEPPPGSLTPGHALRVEVERGRATMQLAPDRFFPSDAGYHVFGRALFFGERMPADTESKRHGWVTLEGTSPMHGSYSQVGFRHDSGRSPFGNFFVLTPWQDCWAIGQTGAQPTPVGRWFCYEWEFDAIGNALRMWQDGMLMVDVAGTGSGCTDGMASRPWVLPARPSVGIGLYTYDEVSLRAWVDDVVLSSSRVGCQ